MHNTVREIVKFEITGAIATIAMNDPQRRNAMGLAMFDGLDAALASVAADGSIHVLLLTGEGAAFCSGFDLEAAVNDPALLGTFINRLSALLRTVHRMPQVVVAAVSGAAIAGGCALLSACDFVFVDADAQLGYPVHRLGVSPAVTIPTLQMALKPGPARALTMSGELIDGHEAHRRGLATHVVGPEQGVRQTAVAFCESLGAKGVQSLRVTKAWLNELDGSLNDGLFDQTARDSAAASAHAQTTSMLAAWWNRSRGAKS